MNVYKVVSLSLFVVSMAIIVLNAFRRDSNFIDIRKIVKNHLEIFFVKGKWIKNQLLLFFGVPLFLATACILYDPLRTSAQEVVDMLILVVTVFISALLSMWSILQGMGNTSNINQENTSSLKSKVSHTILFEVLVCTFILILSLIYTFLRDEIGGLVQKVFLLLIYYLMFVLVLNLLLVFKRLGVLASNSKKGS